MIFWVIVVPSSLWSSSQRRGSLLVASFKMWGAVYLAVEHNIPEHCNFLQHCQKNRNCCTADLLQYLTLDYSVKRPAFVLECCTFASQDSIILHVFQERRSNVVIIRVIEPRWMRWKGYVACVGRMSDQAFIFKMKVLCFLKTLVTITSWHDIAFYKPWVIKMKNACKMLVWNIRLRPRRG